MSETALAHRVIASGQLYVDYDGHSKVPLVVNVYEPHQREARTPYACLVELIVDGEILKSCHCHGTMSLGALIQGLNYLQINLNHFILSRKAVLYLLYYKDEEMSEPVYDEIDFRVIFQNIEYY